MDKIKKIWIWIWAMVLFSGCLVADQLKWNNYNELNAYTAYCTLDSDSIKLASRQANYSSIETFNDLSLGDWTVNTSVEFIKHSRMVNYALKQSLQSNEYININELALGYAITPRDIITVGQMSFKKGAFYEYAYNGRENSDGLFTLYHMNFQGVVWTHHLYNRTRVKVGAVIKSLVDIDTTVGSMKEIKPSSRMIFMFASDQRDMTDNIILTTKLNLSVADMTTKTNPASQRLFLAGYGTSIDARADSGWLAYTIFGASSLEVDNVRRNGYSILMGVRRDYNPEFIDSEMFYGAEVYHSSKYWNSVVPGQPETAYGSGKLGNTYQAYIGIKPKPSVSLKLRYCITQNNYTRVTPVNVTEADIKQKVLLLNLGVSF